MSFTPRACAWAYGRAPLERRQERVVDVDRPPGERAAGARAEDLHVAREDDELDAVPVDQLEQGSIALGDIGLPARQPVVRQAVAGDEGCVVVVRRGHADDLGIDGSGSPSVQEVVEAVALARDSHQDSGTVVAIVELPAHAELVGQRGEDRAPGVHAGGDLVGEVDAHEEAVLVRVAQLLAVQDVAAAVGDGAAPRRTRSRAGRGMTGSGSARPGACRLR